MRKRAANPRYPERRVHPCRYVELSHVTTSVGGAKARSFSRAGLIHNTDEVVTEYCDKGIGRDLNFFELAQPATSRNDYPAARASSIASFQEGLISYPHAALTG